MSYDVYWVKNRAEKITDFEHPTLQGALGCYVRLPRAMPWAVETIGLSARTKHIYYSSVLNYALKGLLYTAQGNALGIRHLRTMRPVRATLKFHWFLQLPLQGALGCYVRLPRAMPWAVETIGLSARTKINWYRETKKGLQSR